MSTEVVLNAWAICDTDGGRQLPMPLARYIFSTEKAAHSHAEYRGFDPQMYPVLPIEIRIANSSSPEQKT